MIAVMPAQPAIGTRIQRRRQVLRLTQEELAAQLGVSKSTVANWETGKHFPRRYLGAIEDVLGVSLDGDLPGMPPPPYDDWERGVLANPEYDDEMKRRWISDSRAVRAAYVGARRQQRAEEAQAEKERTAEDRSSPGTPAG